MILAYRPLAGPQKLQHRRRTGSSHSGTILKWFGNIHHHHHLSLDRQGRWGTTDDCATTFPHFSLFSTALWDFPNSWPVHSLMLSSHLFLCLGISSAAKASPKPPFSAPCKVANAVVGRRNARWSTSNGGHHVLSMTELLTTASRRKGWKRTSAEL